MQGGEAERERAGAVVAAGAGDLLLPEIEEAAGERGRVVVIAPALGLAHGTSIAEAAPVVDLPAPAHHAPAMTIEQKIEAAGLTLPRLEDSYGTNPAAAKYVSHHAVGRVLYLSGCTPIKDGKPYLPGILGEDLTIEEGYEAARHCMLCYLGLIKYALGDLDRMHRMLHLHGYVNSGPDFVDQPRVINGAVDLLVELYGRRMMPTRAAIGCRGLAVNHSVELIATVEFDGGSIAPPLARDGTVLD